MEGSRGIERRTPAQSAKDGRIRCEAVFVEQTKLPLEVALRLVSDWRGFVGVVRLMPCGMVAARAEEEKRARPRNGRWRSICITKKWWFGTTSVLAVESQSNKRCNIDELGTFSRVHWPFIKEYLLALEQS